MILKAQVGQLTNLVVSLKDDHARGQKIHISIPAMSDGNGPGAMDQATPTVR